MTITRPEPTHTGICGQAWQITELPAIDSPVLAVYGLHLPMAHTLWQDYLLSVLHLREVEGVPAAHRWVDGATHEILFIACDDLPLTLADLVRYAGWHSPYQLQLVGMQDERATELADKMARALLEGAIYAEPTGIIGARDKFRLWLRSHLGPKEDYSLRG